MKKLFAIALMLLTVVSISAAETLKEDFNTITNGQKLSTPMRGINIKNGKKLVVK